MSKVKSSNEEYSWFPFLIGKVLTTEEILHGHQEIGGFHSL